MRWAGKAWKTSSFVDTVGRARGTCIGSMRSFSNRHGFRRTLRWAADELDAGTRFRATDATQACRAIPLAPAPAHEPLRTHRSRARSMPSCASKVTRTSDVRLRPDQVDPDRRESGFRAVIRTDIESTSCIPICGRRRIIAGASYPMEEDRRDGLTQSMTCIRVTGYPCIENDLEKQDRFGGTPWKTRNNP